MDKTERRARVYFGWSSCKFGNFAAKDELCAGRPVTDKTDANFEKEEQDCQQLRRLKHKVKNERPGLIDRKDVVFHYDNARPHTSLANQKTLREFSWEALMHPPYSPDLAP
ncbi:Histone-lysine N-methyltransferase SETMAR [Eumeta japonica]|uniref:Histone-lysine N-methyltransferase SETMAR n=1 Tax=Eumeta variegata TaxID=151549 RepID=A0A4C1XEG6_EUMVA|nr:Histone-lysine N-methyltransferase SETMAR [Eumeta japonica]